MRYPEPRPTVAAESIARLPPVLEIERISGIGLSIRIDLPSGVHIGSGTIALLEAVKAIGSISGASRSLGISYRTTWLLIDKLNQAMCEPVVTTKIGGSKCGGASMTTTGENVINIYRMIQSHASEVTQDNCRALAQLTLKSPQG